MSNPRFTMALLFFLLLTCFGCSSNDSHESKNQRLHQETAEYVYRKQNESLFNISKLEIAELPSYPWEKSKVGNYPKITKEFFRCKGCSQNPCHIVQQGDEIQRHYDCGGVQKHSLPLRNDKEFIYPILIDLVNYIQAKTAKRVVITSGHRCPEHNTYVDPSPENQFSKHQIGAEVSFYVQGMEDRPDIIVGYLQEYYKTHAVLKEKKEYAEFQRYEKDKTNVSTPPWFNKEIFIKLFTKKEGRNFDNRHPYPYISIQVRYDRDLNEKVIYTWEKANRNYRRW